jgi:hypothetical protein
MFDMRMNFLSPDGTAVDNKITFSSSYFCCDFLPQDIIMKKIKEDTKQRAIEKQKLEQDKSSLSRFL